MLIFCDFVLLPLWGEFISTVLYLEWKSLARMSEKSLVSLVVHAYHPPTFLSPGGARHGARQDRILRIAYELTGMPYDNGFCTNFNTEMINKSGIRLHHYAKSHELAGIAQEELQKNLTDMAKAKTLRPMSRV